MEAVSAAAEPRTERWYRAVWRWHFYAGLFCVPFVLWLSVTGGLYLFKPQIEAALYTPYRHVASGEAPMLSPDTIAAKAVVAVPGAVLHKYVLPEAPDDAVQVLVLVNMAVLLGLVTLSLSSLVLWWRRRPTGMLGAPSALAPPRHGWALVALVMALALLMPLFGLSLALAVAVEWAVKRAAPRFGSWMGWRGTRALRVQR